MEAKYTGTKINVFRQKIQHELGVNDKNCAKIKLFTLILKGFFKNNIVIRANYFWKKIFPGFWEKNFLPKLGD